jgi:transcriptional regulator with XRE-family HTH domain
VSPFTVGDVIRAARREKRWNQQRLGAEAGKIRIDATDEKIDKSTVSKVERSPYSSRLSTVWRLLAALGLTFEDAEKRVGSPFPANDPSYERPPMTPAAYVAEIDRTVAFDDEKTTKARARSPFKKQRAPRKPAYSGKKKSRIS